MLHQALLRPTVETSNMFVNPLHPFCRGLFSIRREEMDRRSFLEVATGVISGLSFVSTEPEVVVDPSTLSFTAPILRCDVVNGNGRLYSRAVCEKAIQHFNENSGSNMGQLGMPQNAATAISFSEVSHSTSTLHIDSNGYVVATITPLNTPKGSFLKKMLSDPKSKDLYALRTAGIGKCESSPTNESVLVIGDDYKIVSVNVVSKNDACTI